MTTTILQDNVARFGLADFSVLLQVRAYKREECYQYFDPKTLNLVDWKEGDPLPAGVNLIPTIRNVGEPRSLRSDMMPLSEALGKAREFVSRRNPKIQELREGGYEEAWDVEVLADLKDTSLWSVIGRIDSDGSFYYMEAKTIREFTGWIWCSSLGTTQVLSADLDDAVCHVATHVHITGGRVNYEQWSELMNQIYMRDVTVRIESSPYLNPTLAVATRLITGKEHPGFNICW